MVDIAQPPQRNERIIDENGVPTRRFLDYLLSVNAQVANNSAEQTAEQAMGNAIAQIMGLINALKKGFGFQTFTVAQAQARVLPIGTFIIVSDEKNGVNTPAYSDGTTWRRIPDYGAIES